MKNLLPIFVCAFLLFSTSVQSQITDKHYKIYAAKANKEVSISDIIGDMEGHDVLFFGEEHNDSVGHYLEQAIFEALHAKFGKGIALSMEMFDRDVQDVMNEYLRGDIREKNFTKDARVWSNYRDYKPMVEFARSKGLDVICANAPSRYTNLVGRKGQAALKALGEESKSNFAPLPFDTASGKYYEKLMSLSHSPAPKTPDTAAKKAPAMMPMGGFNLIMGQSLWDATMAYSISEYLKKNKKQKVFQVNGRFHSDEGFAIVTQLKKYSPKVKSLIISTGSDDNYPNIKWEDHKHEGDYIIITDPGIPKTYKE